MHDPDGYAVGTLCVVDLQARALTAEQLAALRDLAAQAEQLLALRAEHAALLDVLAEVDHHATRDPLTGLLNRRMLLDRLDQALHRAERGAAPPTLLFCDLDGFKQINDTRGHDAGDHVLVSVAQALQVAARPADTVARLGGDEFVVICDGLPAAAVPTVADRLRHLVLVDSAGSPLALRLSVGAVTPTLPTTSGQLLAIADQRMYADKTAHRQQARAASA